MDLVFCTGIGFTFIALGYGARATTPPHVTMARMFFVLAAMMFLSMAVYYAAHADIDIIPRVFAVGLAGGLITAVFVEMWNHADKQHGNWQVTVLIAICGCLFAISAVEIGRQFIAQPQGPPRPPKPPKPIPQPSPSQTPKPSPRRVGVKSVTPVRVRPPVAPPFVPPSPPTPVPTPTPSPTVEIEGSGPAQRVPSVERRNEKERRKAILDDLTDDFLKHNDLSELLGRRSPPADWLNERLRRRGETWRVLRVDPDGNVTTSGLQGGR